MDFEKSFQRTKTLSLSSTERQKASVLVVEPEAHLRQTLRQSLIGLGYGGISDAGDHAAALQKIEDRHFTHLIFDARHSRIGPKEFLQRAFELDPTMTAIASSYEPTIDDVFDLLISGARGYLVKPFTTESLDEALVMATKGEPISEAVLHARNRNEALASLVLSSLDSLATIIRQSKHFQTARREIPQKALVFRRSVDLGYTFAKGGPMMLREALIDLCLERSQGPATRLGRFRKRQEVRKKRKEQKGNQALSDGQNLSEEHETEIISLQGQISEKFSLESDEQEEQSDIETSQEQSAE
ncbi:MAG: response regulator [Bdellovibrionales bacterium]|nr:response regulator [Bdellovibrionales bacterium]